MRYIDHQNEYNANLRLIVDYMRKEVEEGGYRFAPSFEGCIEIVRKHYLRTKGAIMPTDEAAYYVLLGALEDLHGTDWVNERFGAPAAV